jgi:hypothetical protein
MVLNLHSPFPGALDGGVGGGEAPMAMMEMSCPRVFKWNVLKEMQDCDGRVQNLGRDWMSNPNERGAGLREYIYGLSTRTRLGT